MVDPATAMTIVIPKEYPMVLLGCVLLCCEVFIIPMFTVGPARKKYFNEEFMKQF